MCWIQTFTGRKFYPLDPKTEDVCIEDIAHALSMICRFNGHTKRHYSVAQHSIHCAMFLPDNLQLWGLLHDASEAYLCDLCRPVKYAVRGYKTAEKRLQTVINEHFGLYGKCPSEVKAADERMLATERRDVMGDFGHEWSMSGGDPYEYRIIPWEPIVSERAFIKWFAKITQKDPEPLLLASDMITDKARRPACRSQTFATLPSGTL